MGNEGNLIDKIKSFLKMSEFSNNQLAHLYVDILDNDYVRESGFKPSFSEVKNYFYLLGVGFEYVLKKFGIESIPMHWQFCPEPPKEDNNPNFFCYCLDDFVRISYLNIAIYSSEVFGVFPSYYLFPDKVISRNNFIILMAIEAGFYSYKHKTLKSDLNEFMGEEENTELVNLMLLANSDFNVRLYDTVHEDSFG